MGGMPPMPMPGMGGGMPGMDPSMMQMMGKMGGQGCGAKPAPGPVLGQFNGCIKGFNPKQGRGFISCPDLAATGQSGEVMLNGQELGEFEVGAQVFFSAFLNSSG